MPFRFSLFFIQPFIYYLFGSFTPEIEVVEDEETTCENALQII